jgi:hypothetical protein
MAASAIPETWDEGSGGNAGASRTRFVIAPAVQPAGLERSAKPENVLVVRPIPIESGVLFFGQKNGAARQIRQANYRLENFGY